MAQFPQGDPQHVLEVGHHQRIAHRLAFQLLRRLPQPPAQQDAQRLSLALRGDRIQVSTGGGQQVRWARNGSELFYIAADQRLTSIRVTSGANGKLVLGNPVPLFRTELDSSFLTRQQYVVSPDGQRFLINAATDAIDPPSITLILNWKGTP